MIRTPAVINSSAANVQLCFIRSGRSGVQLADFPPSRPQMQIQHRQLFRGRADEKRERATLERLLENPQG